MTVKLLQISCAAQSNYSKVQYLPHYIVDFLHTECRHSPAAHQEALVMSYNTILKGIGFYILKQNMQNKLREMIKVRKQ